ncbi:MAG TPA: CAP domain-containing protein, partial [Thermoanaerobaculia bacterium]|nr:CAP domain-containing protein [Thermoanaerobaculia bacterium]
GENIAEGQLSVGEVMDTWMRSPGHRSNILDKSFKELGVGLAMGRSGGTHRVLWAQNFGAR